MYHKLILLQYYKKIILRDLILKNLITNSKYLGLIKKIECNFSNIKYLSQSKYLYLLHSIELFFNQKPQIKKVKNRMSIIITLNSQFQIFNNLSSLNTLAITNYFRFGHKKPNIIEIFINKLNPVINNKNFKKINCQIAIIFKKNHSNKESINLINSLFIPSQHEI